MARAYDPFAELDRWFSDATRTPAGVAMPMDLYRDGDEFVAQIDLPGVDPSSIDIDLDDRTLTVRAQRKVAPTENQKWLVRERPTGTFARQLTLGHGVAVDKIAAEYTDGVLSLKIPVAEEAKPRKISVAHTAAPTQIEGALAS